LALIILRAATHSFLLAAQEQELLAGKIARLGAERGIKVRSYEFGSECHCRKGVKERRIILSPAFH
jgi:hypothetical protein